MKLWGIIPARGGSVGIPKKNIRMLGGKPLYRWVLDTAVKSNCFDKIIISTDMKEILEADLPGVDKSVRPCDLAQGGPNSIKKVVRYVLDQYPEKPDAFALLQPTSPFLRTLDIRLCKDAISQYDCDSSQTVKKVAHHDHAYNQRVIKNGWVEFAFPEFRKDTSKQSKPEHYALGNLIMTRTEYFMQTGDFFGRSAGILIPWLYSTDIDTVEDLSLARVFAEGIE